MLPLPAKDQQEIATLLGPGIVGKALPSQPIADASSPMIRQEDVEAFWIIHIDSSTGKVLASE